MGDAIAVHEMPCYGEIYGAHPRTFVFDRHSRRVPAAANGFVSLQAVTGDDEDAEVLSDASSDEEDVVVCGKGALIDLQDSEAEVGAENSSTPQAAFLQKHRAAQVQCILGWPA